MANDNGESHENETFARYPVKDVSHVEFSNLAPTPEWRQQQDQADTDDYTNAMARRADEFQQQGKAREPTQQHGEASQGRSQSNLTQAHQQTEQSKDTRAYAAEKGEAASLAAVRQDAVRTDPARGESQSLAALRRDTQAVDNRAPALGKGTQTPVMDGQRLNRERTQEEDLKQTQEQQQGKEQKHEQEKTPER